MPAVNVTYCQTCGKWTKSNISMAPGTECACGDVQKLREGIVCVIIDAIEAFYTKHPELRVQFTFTLDAESAVGRD